MSSPPEGSDEWKAQDKGPTIIVVCWIVTAISTCFVLGRVYVRGKIMRKFHSDDWFIILGLFCGYISTALSTIAVSYGNGKHMKLLSTEQQQGAILWTTAAFCPGIMSFGLPKLAVISLLTRLMNPGRYHKWFLWWMGIWCQLTLFVTAGLLLGRCTPASSGVVAVYKTTHDTSDLVIWAVVEGSTIIIASSIPVMQPLLELILRRNPFSSGKGSKQTPQYYEHYGSQSKSKSRSGGIELGQRKPKSKPKDDLGLTIIESDDSQENILSPTTGSNNQTSTSSGVPTLTASSDFGQHAADGKIIRTDCVSISYEERGHTQETSASSRWRAI
ncbi:integral membrane protein [Colletotrichum kahawae]|uniref:Integral membrane protein n=1 Tax=Colletotrichum kahawae TaxID=34407 RepID=A0AAD9XZH4_COLKA|nr:integral membrane protein [Colletotrichum kahawae]